MIYSIQTLLTLWFTSHIRIQEGACADSTNALVMFLALSLLKRIDANWAEGDGAGGFPSGLTAGAPAIDTWYHVFLILKIDVDAGTPIYTVDAGFDTDLSATNLLAEATDYTHFRRIGSVLTDGSANILAFTMYEDSQGRQVVWDVLTNDFTTGALTTTRATVTLKTPPGVQVEGKYYARGFRNANWAIVMTPLDAADDTPNFSNGPASLLGAVSFAGVGELMTRTSVSGTIGARSTISATSLNIHTRGWRE